MDKQQRKLRETCPKTAAEALAAPPRGPSNLFQKV